MIVSTQVPDSTRIDWTIDETAQTVTGKFHGHPDIVVSIPDLHPNVARYAALYGIMVRLSRATALSRDPKTGKSPPIAEKHAAALEIAEHYNGKADSWELTRARTRSVDAIIARLSPEERKALAEKLLAEI